MVDAEKPTQWKSTQRRTTKQLFIWTFTWTLSCALATFGPRFLWGNEGVALTLLAIVLNLVLGAVMIRTFILHHKSLDELDQKLHANAMGIALGVGLVFGTAYGLLGNNGLVAKADISALFLVMGPTYIVSLIVSRLRML